MADTQARFMFDATKLLHELLVADGESTVAIGRRLGVDQSTIWRILNEDDHMVSPAMLDHPKESS